MRSRADETTLRIRRFRQEDWPRLWQLLQTTFQAGDTYVFDDRTTEAQALDIWIRQPQVTCIAESEQGELLGTYILKPNQPGRGSHVCNAGYVVAPAARGQGVAQRMCAHSLEEAAASGYDAMQFNFVVSTNERAVRLWQHMGFAIVGTLPKAFRHASLGDVDAYVMYKRLAT
ncbi:MAG: N-acetyltransferase [Pseudomonadota bacterium]